MSGDRRERGVVDRIMARRVMRNPARTIFLKRQIRLEPIERFTDHPEDQAIQAGGMRHSTLPIVQLGQMAQPRHLSRIVRRQGSVEQQRDRPEL